MLIILFAELLLCLFKANEKDRQQYFSGKIFEQVRFFFSATNYPRVMLHSFNSLFLIAFSSIIRNRLKLLIC